MKPKRICDRRNRVQHISMVIVVVIVLGVFTAAMASMVKSTGPDSLDEHSGVVIDAMVYIILALAAGLVGLVLWNVKDMKNTMRANHEELRHELKKKMSIQLHNAICENQVEEEI
jgi:flagellar biosynthesis protein FlhB